MVRFMLRWAVVIAALWTIALIATIVLRSYVIEAGTDPEGHLNISAEYQDAALKQAQAVLSGSGQDVITFLKPSIEIALKFGLIIAILLYAAERIGLKDMRPFAGNDASGIQPIIALVIVGAFSVSALTGLGEHVTDLKDIALVVVGFYFGSRRGDAETSKIAAASSSASPHGIDSDSGAPTSRQTGTDTEADRKS